MGAPGHNERKGAAYVFANDGGAWTEVAKLEDAEAAAQDQFGGRVGIHGDNLIVSSFSANNREGKVSIYTNDAGTWNLVDILSASDAAMNSQFGFSVAISDDYAIIGSDGINRRTGAAYVFKKWMIHGLKSIS